MLVEVEVQSLGLDRSTRSPVVILREKGGERVLPIWIGPAEASAIAMHMAQVEFPRPLTHDLIAAMLQGLDVTLQRVEIPRVEEGTYHAQLVLQRGGASVTLDARPSDSIAIALRTRSTILAADVLLRDVDLELDEDEAAPAHPDVVEEVDLPEGSEGPRMSAEELESYLRKLDPEDFGRFTP